MTAFLLTWKETGWPHDNLVRMAKEFEKNGFVEEPWRIAAHRKAKAGDQVWILKQGRGPKGIFAAGHILGAAQRGEAGNGKSAMMVPVRFEAFVDPEKGMVIGEEATRQILRGEQIAAQASGYPLDENQTTSLEKITNAWFQAKTLEHSAGKEMALTLTDHQAMLRGFQEAGYACVRTQGSVTNPLHIEWHIDPTTVRSYRLWAFDVTHGGGGAEVRAADEFRIQITNGPAAPGQFDQDGATDLLVGYSRDRDAIVAYDRRWLESWSRKKAETGSGGSPSVQVKEADIQAGHDEGMHHLSKGGVAFGTGDIVTMSPAMLPAYLLNHDAVLQGQMSAEQARAMTPVHVTGNVLDYCRRNGFPFEADLVARYLAAMLAKPLVILAGVSGTGKSKLGELVAEFYSAAATPGVGAATPAAGTGFVFVPGGAKADPNRFALVAVRPDWIDNQSILGFVNPITEQYESTQALDLILRAKTALEAAPDQAAAPRYFMLLDEMNLARVEHYFSDWLACTESRRYAGGAIRQQPVPLHRSGKTMKTTMRQTDGTAEEVEVPPAVALPTNLIVTGTVNVDETTYGFSPKVLDRAMVLEFDEVDLDRLRGTAGQADTAGYRFPETLAAFRLPTARDYEQLPAETHAHLVAINAILETARLHIGYRAANEIALFMAIYNDLLPPEPADTVWLRALDAAVLQKILPRLQGNKAKLEVPLSRLCGYLQNLALPAGEAALADYDPAAAAKLPKAYRRAVEMLEGLRDFGFVSFFK